MTIKSMFPENEIKIIRKINITKVKYSYKV